MEQVKLEEKVQDLFEQQGFELEKNSNKFKATQGDTNLTLKVFSSENFTIEDVKSDSSPEEKIFVDEELTSVKDELDCDVSVLKNESNSKDLEVPSYERIGDIVVVSELDNLSEEKAVEGILEHNPGIDSILLKDEKVSGEFCIGGYTPIYGEKTETVHKEHGCRIKVDPTEMFFSEREGTERRRIFESVNPGEEVLVMFAGAGPFPVTMAKNSDPGKVVGVEKNPEAVKYARDNLEMNKVGAIVEMIEGDVKDVCPELGEFDRVLTPSPTNALEFVEEALGCVRDNGVLVVYSVEDKENLYGRVIDTVEAEADNQNLEVEVLKKRVVADFSPAKRKVAVEFKVNKK